jgi:hypothetical protein
LSQRRSTPVLADRHHARSRRRALDLAVVAVGAYLLVVAVVFAAPELLAGVLIGGVDGILGIGVGTAVAASALR